MLPVKKLYIDSKARTKDSKSATDFSIDLVESLNMPEGAAFQVCDVLIPHTWYLIDENSCNMYISERKGPASAVFTLTLPTGNYDGPAFSREIGKQLHETTTKLYLYNVNYDEATERLHISANGINGVITPHSFAIMTDEEVLAEPSLNVTQPKSLNKFLGNTTPREYVPDLDEFISKRLQFNPVKYIFIKIFHLFSVP